MFVDISDKKINVVGGGNIAARLDLFLILQRFQTLIIVDVFHFLVQGRIFARVARNVRRIVDRHAGRGQFRKVFQIDQPFRSVENSADRRRS